MSKNSAKKGFTLVELLVVIAIVAVLATVSIIGYTSFIKKAHMSNDTALANQVNTLLSGHRVYEKVDDEQSIAKVLRNGKIASDVKIESQKYDMDIFYNESKGKFELMSNQEGTSQHYKTLHYYLNLEESEDIPITPPQEPEVDTNKVSFSINETYREVLGAFINYNSKQDNMTVEVSNKQILVKIAIDESGNIKNIKSTINLDDIITATDSFGNSLDMEFDCEAIDLVEIKPHKNDNNFQLNGSKLTIYTPGMYLITAKFEDETYTIPLNAINAFWTESPTIQANTTSYSFNKSASYITIGNVLKGLIINSYDELGGTPSEMNLVDREHFLDRIAIIIEASGETITTQMNKSEFEYTIPVDSLDLSSDDTISVKFRYQSITGIYCYSEEIIIKVE